MLFHTVESQQFSTNQEAKAYKPSRRVGTLVRHEFCNFYHETESDLGSSGTSHPCKKLPTYLENDLESVSDGVLDLDFSDTRSRLRISTQVDPRQ